MKSYMHVIAGLALAVSAASQGCTAQNGKDDFEGTWDLVYIERDGKPLKVQKGVQSTYAGGKFVVKNGDKIIVAGSVKLDPAKKPKALDVTYTEGPDKGKSFKAIYERDGDTMKFCRPASPDQDRPTVFKMSPEKPGLMTIYKRAKD
jgi:uncharacterized protein (TIGR03067 family)